jgi:hypothetical protein
MAEGVSFASTTTDENYIAELARFTERSFLTDSPVPFGAMVLNTRTGERRR